MKVLLLCFQPLLVYLVLTNYVYDLHFLPHNCNLSNLFLKFFVILISVGKTSNLVPDTNFISIPFSPSSRSLIKLLNKFSPHSDPCGTPLSTLTFCLLSFLRFYIHKALLLSKPIEKFYHYFMTLEDI